MWVWVVLLQPNIAICAMAASILKLLTTIVKQNSYLGSQGGR